MVIEINLIDENDSYDCENLETVTINIKDEYVDKIEDTYCAWEMFWNNGEGFKNYEDFIEYYDDDDIIVKDNFETFSNIGLNGWHLSTFVDLLVAIYPDAEINTIVVDKKIKFIW